MTGAGGKSILIGLSHLGQPNQSLPGPNSPARITWARHTTHVVGRRRKVESGNPHSERPTATTGVRYASAVRLRELLFFTLVSCHTPMSRRLIIGLCPSFTRRLFYLCEYRKTDLVSVGLMAVVSAQWG